MRREARTTATLAATLALVGGVVPPPADDSATAPSPSSTGARVATPDAPYIAPMAGPLRGITTTTAVVVLHPTP